MRKFLISNRRKLLKKYHYELFNDKSVDIDKNLGRFNEKKILLYKNILYKKSFIMKTKKCNNFFFYNF